uniref:Rab3 GTPase-activating protein catalytic subunit n=1 Tax=Aceria tosichella TaxID=561515 RepID=A0A6G1SI09_9ACAR
MPNSQTMSSHQTSSKGEGVFEITDYTTASDWERFISSLEEILSEWKLNKQSENINFNNKNELLPDGFISSGLWLEKRDTLKFNNVTFDVRYQYLQAPPPSTTQQIVANTSREQSTSDQWNDLGDKPEDEDHERRSPESADSLEYHDADPERSVQGLLIEEEKEHQEYELPADLPECLRDMVSTNNDFASKAHCLVRWYNLRHFIILAPRGDTIVTEDRVKLILSSASVALANIDCHIPIFVQILNPRNHFYQGISEHVNIRTMYEMVFFKRNIEQYSYLSELISLFREKISCNLTDPISATIRLNYCLDFFELFIVQDFEGNEHNDDDDESARLSENKKKISKMRSQDMRSGATFEQVKVALEDCLPHPFKILKFIHVAALWPPLSDKVITDSPVHSDLDPVEAPIWTARCVTSDTCNMKIVHETQAINDLLSAAIEYAYTKLDASQIFNDCDRQSLEAECLRISYELATNPEVIISRSPSDSIRKLIALLFYRASELKAELDALDQIAAHLKKRPSLSEIYRDFRKQKPSVKEFILRTQISRPFNPIQTPALPQRMFCTICDQEFRLCGAFSELCN